MRYLMFNLVVLGALGYLFVAEKGDGFDIWSIVDPGDPRHAGETRTSPVSSYADPAEENTGAHIQLPVQAQKIVSTVIDEVLSADNAAAPASSQAPAPAPSPASAPPAMPPAVSVAVVETHKPDMQVTEESWAMREEVREPAVSAPMMSSRERRGELYKLAQDMELMFVERNGQ